MNQPISVPIDALKLFPTEDTSGDNNECVAFTWADILGNLYGTPFDLEFSYAGGLFVSGATPSTLGEDPQAGASVGVIFGGLPVSGETFTTQSTSQLYTANFANYTADQKIIAKKYAQNGLIPLTSYTAIANYILQYQIGAGLAVNWYQSFNDRVVNGVLPMPLPNEQPISKHMVAVYDSNVSRLVIKSWQGANVGLGGYLIMPLPVFDVCFVEAYGYNSKAWRWFSLASLALQYPNTITSILPQL